MRLLGVALTAAILAGCSLTPPADDPVQIKLNDLETRLTRIERANQSVIEMAQRLEAAQSEMRSLRGRIEELENSAEGIRKQQRDLYADLDKRVSQIGTLPPAGSAGSAAGGAGAGGTAGEQAAYAQAFDALRTGSYPAAIAGFKQFLLQYPVGELADNARYWLGEAYYVTRDFPNAALSFREVVERSPNSRKAPDALVKLGFTQQELKQNAEARATLNDVVRRFPDTDAARLAQERLRRLPPDGR